MLVDGKHILRKTNPKFILLGDAIAQPSTNFSELLRFSRYRRRISESQDMFPYFLSESERRRKGKRQNWDRKMAFANQSHRSRPRLGGSFKKKNAVRASHPNRIRKRESRLCLLLDFCGSAASLCSASASPFQAMEAASAHKAHSHRSCSAAAVPLGGTVSEEAATPGLPATLSRFGNRFSNLLGSLTYKAFRLRRSWFLSLAAEPPLTITGSATFTLAVSELSRISFRAAMGIRPPAVRNLWTL